MSQEHVDPSDWEALREVLAEAGQHLDSVELQLLGLGAPDPQALDRAFGSFRAMKLVASSLQLEPIANLARSVEAAVDRARRGRSSSVSPEITVHALTSARRLLHIARPRTPPPAGPDRVPSRKRRGRRR